MKIDWKMKISSRKFWVAVVAWISSLLTAFHVTDNSIAQIVVIISGIGSLCVYIWGESRVDSARAAPL